MVTARKFNAFAAPGAIFQKRKKKERSPDSILHEKWLKINS